MDLTELSQHVESLEGTLIQRPGPGDGTPEIAWGDLFVYYAPDGVIPAAQPFVTVVTKDYPGEPSSRLDRPDAFRVNVAVGTEEFVRLIGREPREVELVAADRDDEVLVHPVYGQLGWVCVVNPGERSGAELLALVDGAHEKAKARFERRRAE